MLVLFISILCQTFWESSRGYKLGLQLLQPVRFVVGMSRKQKPILLRDMLRIIKGLFLPVTTGCMLFQAANSYRRQSFSSINRESTLGARKSGRLREVVAYEKNQENKRKTELIN